MRERVAALLAYNPDTGIFTWKVARGCARIFINGKQHHLGTFKTVEEASRAYVTAKRQLHQGGVI